MPTKTRRLRTQVCLTLLLGIGLHANVQAQITVERAWARATVPNQTATGAFMILIPQKDLLLTGASSPTAGVVELHEMKMDKDIMRMRPSGDMPLKAGQSVELKSGGLHIMMMDLKRQLKAGDVVPLTLTFKAVDGSILQREVKAIAGFSQPPK